MAGSSHREAEVRSSHPEAAARPSWAEDLREEARHSSRTRAGGVEAAHHGRVR